MEDHPHKNTERGRLLYSRGTHTRRARDSFCCWWKPSRWRPLPFYFGNSVAACYLQLFLSSTTH